MAYLRITSPHLVRSGNTGNLMLLVIAAALPGLAMLTYFFGWGNLINVVWASLLAIAFEAVVLLIRKKPLGFYLGDFSALLTGILLGLALPPLVPWWVTMVATGFAIVVAKHLYGGLGQNPFNPAMVGYALVLIGFPVEMTSWAGPQTLNPEPPLSFMETLAAIFPVIGTEAVDGFTMATPLDLFKHQDSAAGVTDIWATAAILSPDSWLAWQCIGLAYLVGGLFLLYRKVFTWHMPASLLLTLAVLSYIFWWMEPSHYGSPELHLLGGATMLGAFFIATDPVTSATSVKGKLIYGAGIGALIYTIRVWGGYPDAVAFAVLLMNFAAPLIDSFTQPRSYGHKRSRGRLGMGL